MPEDAQSEEYKEMTNVEQYDALVIGAGQSGGPLSTALAQAGKKTAIVEREHVGGTCVNVGCTPTKTMVASARVAYLARRAADYGVSTGPIRVDLSVVRQRKRSIVESWQAGSRSKIESAEGVELLMGAARFSGPKTVAVQMNDGTQRELRAEQIFINVGTRNSQPPIEGLDSVPALDSTSIMELGDVPEHLIVLGGGYIGMEFSQMFRRFGSDVTVIQRGPQLLPREDADIGDEVADILRDDGITVLLNTNAKRVEQAADGGIALTAESVEGEQTVRGSHLLVATGRRPNTDLLNVEAAGLETGPKGVLVVNDRLETNVPGIYAMGDVKGGPAFTHISYDDFRVIRTNLLEGGSASIAGRMVPYTVFIDPQLGRVGLTEEQAREQGYNVRVAKLPMSSVARAIEFDETRGVMKAVVDADTEQILGAAILGLEGGEVVNVLQVAMMGQLPYTALRDGVLPHPTLAESLNNLFTTLD
jgi:pyruvate/2-oxoglutarate dehydrogenase complex dihydrolipoamide dehydrogenase (E3) component